MSAEKGKNPPPVVNRQVTDEAVFKVTKEIVVKFIEVGRLTPANFEETYDMVFKAVKKSVHPE